MKTSYKTAAETAKYVRQQLKACFPGVKFSVRSDTYSMGASLSVRWTDGPTESAVYSATDRYRQSDFDGSDDSTRQREDTMIALPDGTVEMVRWGVNFINCSRTLSPAYQAQLETQAAKVVAEKLGRDWSPADWYPQFDTGYGVCYPGEGHHVAWYLSLHIAPAA